MEKDLREAYAALKLLRADLLQTRRDKRALEAAVAHLQPLAQSESAARLQETLLMREEDLQTQFRQFSQSRDAELAVLKQELAQARAHADCSDGDTEDMERLELASDDGHSQQKQQQLLKQSRSVGDNQQEEEGGVDALVQEKLALLAKLHSLSATIEQQTEALVTQRAQFVQENDALALDLENTRQELAKLKREMLDAQHEQQATAEKDAFLQTQLEMLAADKRELVSQVEALEADKQEIANKLEAVEMEQLRGHLELEVALEDAKRLQSELEATEEQCKTQTREGESKLVAYAQTSTILKQQLAEKEDELETLQRKHESHEQEAQAKHKREMTELREKLGNEQKIREQELGRQHKQQVESLKQEKELREEDWARQLEQIRQDHEKQKEAHDMKVHDLESRLTHMQDQLEASERKRGESAQQSQAEMDAMRVEATQRAAQHEKAMQALAMEKRALQQEIREARQITKFTKDELLKCQATLSRERTALEEECQAAVAAATHSEKRCSLLETQLLAAEDRPTTVENVPSSVDPLETLEAFQGVDINHLGSDSVEVWQILRRGVRELGAVLPKLQALLRTLSDALTLCGDHADALPTLCEQLNSKQNTEGPVAQCAVGLLRFVVTLKHHVEQCETPSMKLKSVRDFHQRVVDALSQWYECDASQSNCGGSAEAVPPPAFAISSRETALILQNWTRDRSAQLAAKRWLARMEAYPHVPVLRTKTRMSASTGSNDLQELLPREGSTLELEHMTPEVKDAFRLLLVPILKQNPALHVRVFTRRASSEESSDREFRASQVDEPQEKRWAMRIHVQAADIGGLGRRGPPSALTSTTSATGNAMEPLSGLAPTSPASSVSSSTSSTASNRLQLLQERLHQLHSS